MKNIIFAILVYLITEFDNYSYSKNFQNNIILKVENEIITSFEIKNKIISSLILSNQEISQENIDRLKSQALEALIQYKLKKIELSKHDLKDDQNQINKYLLSISFNDIDGLKKKFKNYDLDFEIFLDEIKTQLKWQRFIYKIYSNKIEIDEKMVDQEIENLKKNKKSLEEFRLSEIEVLYNDKKNEEIVIKNIKDQIDNFGFEDAAIKLSISNSSSQKGDIGWISGKSMSKEIFLIVKNMKIGEVSKPIKRQNSILFLKLKDKRLSNTDNLDLIEVKKKIINRKKNELFNLYSNSYLSKLKNTSLIEYK